MSDNQELQEFIVLFSLLLSLSEGSPTFLHSLIICSTLDASLTQQCGIRPEFGCCTVGRTCFLPCTSLKNFVHLQNCATHHHSTRYQMIIRCDSLSKGLSLKRPTTDCILYLSPRRLENYPNSAMKEKSMTNGNSSDDEDNAKGSVFPHSRHLRVCDINEANRVLDVH
jgi:hypothetical protein